MEEKKTINDYMTTTIKDTVLDNDCTIKERHTVISIKPLLEENKQLIDLLKEIADFRVSHYVPDEEKVFIILPQSMLRKELFKDLVGKGVDNI